MVTYTQVEKLVEEYLAQIEDPEEIAITAKTLSLDVLGIGENLSGLTGE